MTNDRSALPDAVIAQAETALRLAFHWIENNTPSQVRDAMNSAILALSTCKQNLQVPAAYDGSLQSAIDGTGWAEIRMLRHCLGESAADIEELMNELTTMRSETIEKAAQIADTFNCGACGIDGKVGAAIRALSSASPSPVLRDAVIEECAKVAENHPPTYDRYPVAIATAIRALASRPVSEREGSADTAPAPAISGGESVREALRAFIRWGEQQCPCHEETPDPCPLCDATVAAGRCKAVEAKFPRRILEDARAALAAADRSAS